jgi:low temperature requirement protein LtrA
MTGRDPEEPYRASKPLELLFDLCFVVAVSQAAGALHHDLVDGRIGWVARLAIGPPLGLVLIVVLGVLELLVPVWAERAGRPTPWHPEHIGERYGLFTIIVLGECVLAVSAAVQLAMAAGGVSVSLLAVALGGLLLVFALWWSYFKHPAEIDRNLLLRQAVTWGYSHYFVFAAIAALGAGLQVAVDATHSAVALSPSGVALTVAIPVVLYIFAMGMRHGVAGSWFVGPSAVIALILLALALGATWFGVPAAVVAMALAQVGFVAYAVASARQPEVTSA